MICKERTYSKIPVAHLQKLQIQINVLEMAKNL